MAKLVGIDGVNLNGTIGSKSLGTMGELTAACRLEKSGYCVSKPQTAKAGDLWVTDKRTGRLLKIEVKTARRGSRGEFQFCMYRQIKGGRVCTDHSYADYVILLCVETDASYRALVIPAAELTVKQVSFKEPKRSRFAQYLRSYSLTVG